MSVSGIGSSPASVKDLSDDERWALATRIAGSPGFSKATQLRELLLFLCRQSIESPSAELTEQEIGARVLGRRPDYDTQSDNIVRVQIRHLRQKLDEYFANGGREEHLLLSIPKGSRVPRFETRIVAVTPPPANKSQTQSAGYNLLRTLLPLLVVTVAAFLLGRYSAEQVRSPGLSAPDLSEDPLWATLFNKTDETTIVLSDSSLAFAQDMMQANLSLDELSKGSLRKIIESTSDDRVRHALREISARQYTSIADAAVASRLYAIGGAMGTKVNVRYSRHMTVRDFNFGNFIFLGSRRGIQWVELFEPDLRFHLRLGPDKQFGIHNRQPADGEASTYSTVRSSDGRYETYAVVAFLPNLKGTGHILMLEGIMMEGTEAAGEFAMSRDFAKLLGQKFGAIQAGKIPRFEILLKVQAVSGAPSKVEAIAASSASRFPAASSSLAK